MKVYDCSRVNTQNPFTDTALKLSSLVFAVSRKATSDAGEVARPR